MIRDIIAKRYAKAYFELADEQGRLSEAQTELCDVVAFFDAEAELRGVLYNPVFETAQRKAVLNALLDKFELSKSLRSLLNLLVDKNKLAYVDLVAENFSRMVDDAEGRLKVEITSAAPLDEDLTASLRDEFSKLSGKNVELEVEIDESLLGGVVARYGGMVYDGSIKTQLKQMGEALRA
ncbi:MAG: ATP synthase F1 subunit delta [Deltaproteobacteria bacterium]|nr:ATP synthase F1 subunit delta [Deltaproteobacteria bacterium]